MVLYILGITAYFLTCLLIVVVFIKSITWLAPPSNLIGVLTEVALFFILILLIIIMVIAWEMLPLLKTF